MRPVRAVLSRWPVRGTAAVLIIAGLVHLTTIFWLAREDGSALRRIAALGHGAPLQTFAAPPDLGRLLPYRDPAVATAICIFDLRQGPVQVRLDVTPLDVASLSVYGPDGAVLYGLTNGAAVGGAITLSLALAQTIMPDPDAGVPRVALSGPDGFVMADALASMPSARPAAEITAGRLACRREKP